MRVRGQRAGRGEGQGPLAWGGGDDDVVGLVGGDDDEEEKNEGEMHVAGPSAVAGMAWVEGGGGGGAGGQVGGLPLTPLALSLPPAGPHHVLELRLPGVTGKRGEWWFRGGGGVVARGGRGMSGGYGGEGLGGEGRGGRGGWYQPGHGYQQ